MKRELLVKITVNWDDYEDVTDELVLEDTGIYEIVKDNVFIELINTVES
jgi:hypothetical protein